MSVAEAPGVTWRKSSACLPSDCVEVAIIRGHVLIRDSSASMDGRVLVFERDRWRTFIRHLAHGGIEPGEREQLPESAAPPPVLVGGHVPGNILEHSHAGR